MDIDERIKLAADEIRSYGAVAILGAGISLGQGFPLTRHLQMLLWNALDSDEDARKELAAKLGQKLSTTKQLIGDDPNKTDLALKILASSHTARGIFQNNFKALNDDKIKNPSNVHDIISELLHRRNIKMVISLNWDTLLETAYHRHYGGTIHPGSEWLKKLHGDAANPDLKWTLPNEPSNLPEDIIQDISMLAEDYPKVLLIIGYSENDEEIVSKIIEPLSSQWRVIRIGPHATDENSIPLSAKEALPKLHGYINDNPELPGCEYINFDNQHDLGSALSGIGLGPSDVNVCPRLPEVDIAKQQLEEAGSSVIIGKMGSGKSLIAYQTAHDLNKDGWEILRLKKLTQSKEQLIAHLLALPHKSLLIIDNAQSFDEDIVSYILENATDKLRVLALTTDDNISRYNKIHIANERALSFIAEDFRNRQNEILPIIQRFDRSIGEGYLDIPLEQRINDALKSSGTPWQFNFILTGGWRRADAELAILHENERSDLLLAAISIKQIVSLDTGSSLEWLEEASEMLGKDKSWMNLALNALRDRHLIIEGDTIRCPHVRFSEVVIDIIYSNREENYKEQLINLFRTALYEAIGSLKGIFWVLSSWRSSRDSSYLFGLILDSQIMVEIIERCWAASSNEDIGYASLILSILAGRYPDSLDDFASHSEQIATWIEEADVKSLYGLGDLLNNLGQRDHELTEAIIDLINPQIIDDKLSQIGISDAYVWGYFLGRLCYAASHKWIMQLKNSLDSSALQSLFAGVEVDDVEINSLDELAEGLLCFDDSLAIKLVDSALPQIASAFNNDIIEFQDITHIIWFVLGFAPDFLRQEYEPSSDQKQIAYKLADSINAEAVAQFISKSRRRDWENYAKLIYFLKEVMPEKATEISHLIDFDVLDETSKGLWGNQPHELIQLIHALATEDDGEPVRSWINRHSEEFVSLDLILVAVAPESTTAILGEGYNLNLNLDDLAHWNLATVAVGRLSTVDKKLASIVINSNQQGITKGFELKNDRSDYKCFPEFIELMGALSPDILKECLESLDPTIISISWSERLKGNSEERLAAETLINLVIKENITSLVDIAQELKHKNH